MTRVLPQVSVIVPVHGDRGGLAATLDALAAQDYDGDVQVIVVDNGDNPMLPASRPGLDVLTEPVRGSYAARNTGVAAARGEILAFTDADCRPAPTWLSRGVAALLAAPDTALGGRIDVQLDGGHATGAALWDRRHGLRQDIYVLRDGYAATANLLVTRTVFARVGPFDGSLRSGGDRDWGERATRAGTPVVYGPDVLVAHPARSSLGELQRKTLRLHRGWAAVQVRRGQPPASARELVRRMMPHSRSILRHARALGAEGFGPAACARYAAVGHWIQYVSLIAWLRAAREQ